MRALFFAAAAAAGLAATPIGVVEVKAAETASGGCSAWTAEEQEDEGGPVFTASACAKDDPDTYVLLTCFDGQVFIRYDLVGKQDFEPHDQPDDVVFAVDGAPRTLAMQFEEMDGMHSASVSLADGLVSALSSGTSLSVSDPSGRFASHDFALAGSSRALKALASHCG